MLWLQDLKSSNGSFVNKERVPPGERVAIQPGDQVQLGRLEIELSFPDLVLNPSKVKPTPEAESGAPEGATSIDEDDDNSTIVDYDSLGVEDAVIDDEFEK